MTVTDEEFKETELQKMKAEAAKLLAETEKLEGESKFYPYVILTGGIAAIGALASILVRILF
ncbi:MAG: hypothetical protein AAGK33_10725 [Pseudomonadota bacterium]